MQTLKPNELEGIIHYRAALPDVNGPRLKSSEKHCKEPAETQYILPKRVGMYEDALTLSFPVTKQIPRQILHAGIHSHRDHRMPRP
jgi:hypothetical protein